MGVLPKAMQLLLPLALFFKFSRFQSSSFIFFQREKGRKFTLLSLFCLFG